MLEYNAKVYWIQWEAYIVPRSDSVLYMLAKQNISFLHVWKKKNAYFHLKSVYIHSGFCNSSEPCMLSQLYYGQVFVQMAQSASEGEVTLSDLGE